MDYIMINADIQKEPVPIGTVQMEDKYEKNHVPVTPLGFQNIPIRISIETESRIRIGIKNVADPSRRLNVSTVMVTVLYRYRVPYNS
jgi:hypothetical protein